MHPCHYWGIIDNSQDLRATQLPSIDEWGMKSILSTVIISKCLSALEMKIIPEVILKQLEAHKSNDSENHRSSDLRLVCLHNSIWCIQAVRCSRSTCDKTHRVPRPSCPSGCLTAVLCLSACDSCSCIHSDLYAASSLSWAPGESKTESCWCSMLWSFFCSWSGGYFSLS